MTQPHNELERNILGAAIAGNVLPPEFGDVSVGDFVEPLHSRIFEAIRTAAADNQPIDEFVVGQYVSGVPVSYIAEIASAAPLVFDFAKWTGELRTLSRRRAAHEAIKDVLGKLSSHGSVEAASGELMQRFADITADARKPYTDMREGMRRVFGALEHRQAHPEAGQGLLTGYADLDSLLSGLRAQDLIIIAARPSMGKTALALNIAARASRHVKDGAVSIYSMEMSQDQVFERILSAESGVRLSNIRSRCQDADWPRISNAMGRLYEQPMIVDDRASPTIDELRYRARTGPKPTLLVVDYLQLIRAGTASTPRVQQVGEVSRGLKAMAKDLNCPVIALAQLSRACEQRQDKRPQLSDLRDSGEIEQDADIVAFLYRDAYYNDEANEAEAELHIAKNRNGPTGKISLHWDPERVRFDNLSKFTHT